MKVVVRYFASLAERTGTREEPVEVAPGTTVAELWSALAARHASLGGLSYRPMAACDAEQARWDRPLDGVAEVAFLPPVSGG